MYTMNVWVRSHVDLCRLRYYYHSSPNPNTFLPLINLSRSSHDLKRLYSLLIVHGLQSHELLVTELLRSFFHLGLPSLALSAFDRVEKPKLRWQNFMVRTLCHHGLYDDVLRVVSLCRVSGLCSDEFTFPSLIKSCSALGDYRAGKQAHCLVLRAGFYDNLVVRTSLVDFYAKCGFVRSARYVLDQIPQPDLVALNALIAGYSLNGFDREAVEVFGRVLAMDLKPNLSTLASVIPICSRFGWIESGRSLHCFSTKCGYLATDFLLPALISMYTWASDLSSATNLFDSVKKKSVSVWNSMISGYTQTRVSAEALFLFRGMIRNDVHPDLITYISVIPSCEDFDSKSLGESLHASVFKHGVQNHLPVLAALMSMYAKLGNVSSAECIFNRLPFRNRLSWNSLISGYICNGRWESGLTAFTEMQFAGFGPDEVSIVNAVSACSKLKTPPLLGRSLHGFSLRKGFDSFLNVSNALLAFYGCCHQISSCFRLFREMNSRSVISWNTLISSCVSNREPEMAATVFHDMRKEGINMDSVTLISILPAISETGSLQQGTAFHCYSTKSGFFQNTYLINAFISMYCGHGDLDAGKFLFEHVPEKCVVTWNAMLTGFRDHGLHEDVRDLFDRMVRDGNKPNHISILSLLPTCENRLRGKSVHGFSIRTGIVQETPVHTSLIFMYSRFDDLRSCHMLFRIGRKEDISLWNAMMSVHTQMRNPREAIAFFSSLLRMGLEPDNFTTQSLISACIQLNCLQFSDSVLSYLLCKGLDKEVNISNALIDMYAKCGKILISRKLFDLMTRKDNISWSLMINAYGSHGDGKSALDLFSQMVVSGAKPDGAVYSSVLSACSHSGLTEEGLAVFSSMDEHGVFPGTEHYACLVDLLARSGNLREAYDVVMQMPFEPSMSLLEALLGGCSVHGNVEIGEEVSRKLFELDPENPRPYVMLYNVYACAGRWVDAERVRCELEKRRLRKVAGFSYVVGHER